MEERIACIATDPCLDLEPNTGESESDLSESQPMSVHLRYSQQIEAAFRQSTTGDHLRQQSIVSSLDKIALDETAIKDTDKNDLIALQSEVDKGYKQPDSNVRCTNEFLAHGESKKNDRMHLNQDACDSSSMCRPDVNPGEHEEALCSSVRRSAMHVDGMYSNSVEDSGRFAIEAVNHDEALPKMLSGALETVDSKHVQEKIRLINRIGICTRSDISTENAGDGCQHTLSYRKSSVAVSPIRSESESDDYGSSVVNETCQSDVESVVKKRFLSLLHEFAAMKQSEGEHLITPSDMASCIENFVNSDAFVCESRRLNFVNLIRKKMGHAGVLTDFMTDDIYQEILQKNKGFLGTIAGNDLAFLIPPTGISTNGGCVTTLCSEEKGDAIPNQKSNVPSLDATADSLLEDVDHELSNLAETPGKDFEEQSKLFVVKEEANSDAMKFSVGDLVWAKVKSHPWWPGQIFDAQDASAAAKKKQKPDRLLVAFFGDGTYGWLQESQLIPFIPNFADKVKQSPAKRFCKAVAGALDEVCKRTELGLRCLHSSEEIYSLNVFPDSNLGVRRGVRIRCHQDIEVSKSKFQPTKVLKFIQAAACCPIYPLSSGLEYSEVLGHVYGFRSFMLSPHMEESKITLLNMLNSHKTVKASRSSTLKRRHGMDEFSTVLNAEMGQEVKRKHVSKDVSEDEIKGPLTGSRVESPRSRSMGTSMSEIAEQSKPPISEDKSSELAKRGISLAVDKFCPSVSSEREETGGHRSLELPESGVKATANMLTSVDDDSKTLFDMTGLYSLKKRKKSALVSVSNAEGRMTNQQPFEVVQQEQPKKLDASMIMEDKTCPLDSGAFLNATGPCPRLKDARSMEDEIDKLGQLDSKDDAESYEKVEGERLGASANCAEDIIEKEESQLFHLEVTDSEQNGEDKRHLEASGKEKYGIDEERNHIGLLRQSIKKVSEVLHSGKTANDNEELSADLKESEAYLDAAEKDLKKQWKCLHPEAAGTPRLLEVSKKKKGDIEEKESLLLDTSYNEEEFTGRILKTFKLGESGRKSIGAWRVAPPSLKQTKHISSSKVSFTADDKPEDVKIAKSQALPQIAIVSAGGKDIQGHRMSLPRLLSTLKLVAMDPLRSADGESSFDGVMPVFLRFRNMVFVKSSGYVAASSGKLMSSIADGHILRTRKVADKSQSCLKDLSYLKDSPNLERPSANVEFIGNAAGTVKKKRVSLETVDDAKTESHEECGLTFGGQLSDVRVSSTVSEMCNGETQIGDDTTTVGTQALGLQELASAARKRKLEMLKGTEAKTLGKRDAPKGLPELLPLGKKFKDRRFSSTMFHVKSVKHHISKAERLVLPKKSPAQASGNTKAALVLYMQFPKDHPLPSESELKEVFSRFGTIETSGIKINKIASTAQVLFRDKAHAEKAWLYARKNRIFGPANVSYRLRHFSSSSNDDLKHFAVAFDKKSCPNILASSSTVQNLGASSMKEICMNRSEEESSLILSHSTEESLPKRLYPNDEFLRESEPVCKGATTLRCMPLPTGPTAMNFLNMESSTGIGDKEHISSNTFEPLEISPDEPKTESLVPAVPMCMGLSPGETDLWSSFRIPYESQHETILNPGLQSSFSTCSTNPSSEQNVNVHSGDIKDEMLKLLRQVSLIVNSTSLAPKNF